MNLLENKISLCEYYTLKQTGLNDKNKIQLIYSKKTKKYFGRIDNDYKLKLDFIKNNKVVINKSERLFLLCFGINKEIIYKMSDKFTGNDSYYIIIDNDMKTILDNVKSTSEKFIKIRNKILRNR